MTRKTTLPWDLEHAMTAFQVDPRWYEKYWLTPEQESGLALQIIPRSSARLRRSDPTKADDLLPDATSGFGKICRCPDGSIDMDYYRRRAARDREQMKRETIASLAAHLSRTCLSLTSALRSQPRPLSCAKQPPKRVGGLLWSIRASFGMSGRVAQ